MNEITVCIATVDRPTVDDAIASVLDQRDAAMQVVVVHQGPAAAADALADRWRHRPEVQVVHQDRLRLSASRNLGLAHATTPWVAFLDDDDQLLPAWSGVFDRLLGDGVGIASCSVELVDPEGKQIGVERADRPVPLVGDVIGSHLPGSWVARRDLLDDVGGYLPGIACSHQTELWLRLVPAAERAGLAVVHEPTVGLHVVREAAMRRPMATPRILHDGGRWLAARHRAHLDADRGRRADVNGALGVSAARLGRWTVARRHAGRALRAQPTDPRRWARLALTLVPPLGRRVWGVAPAGEPSTLPVVRTLAADEQVLATHPNRFDDLLFLPHGYQTNPGRSADAEGTPFWTPDAPTGGNDVRFQDPVYRWAARMLRRGTVQAPVVDIGCGSGHKLVARIAPVTDRWLGVDQPSGIATAERTFPDGNWLAADLATDEAWAEIAEHRPGLVLCADVIEHLDDPYALLDRLRDLAGPDGLVLLSTPDRSRLDDNPELGPPRNPRHIREWSHAELQLLLEAARFQVVAERHLLPRRYSPTVLELKRTVHRALHGRMIPDRRSCQAFLLRPAR